MSSGLIFITGATGFIGASTALAALNAGYRLRISVRKESQIESLKNVFSDHANNLEFVVVPDITVPGAFSKVLDNVEYILHVASPLAVSVDKDKVHRPAIEGTLNILRDAAKIPSIKKVVITSSIAAFMPLEGPTDGLVLKEESSLDLSVDPNRDYDEGNDLLTSSKIYHASKLLANQASWEFLRKESPSFVLITIHPSVVYGHNLIQKSAEEIQGSTNGLFFDSIMNGAQSDFPLLSVYVGDVAEAHVKALSPALESSSSYLVSGQPMTWKDVVDVLQKDYPTVPHKLEPSTNPKVAKIDTSKAEKELGLRWAKPEKFIKEVMDQQLGFLKHNP
ncbi:putative nad dependent epimerase dehydratase family protein [Botrytis fragariae]|uniref:Putative nad dependent epimerase dehydratase family protein n=1 Tax=Botrytis fragariae TaxID=1964551 RepID=A0A8H6AK89_9HELO|nr:putative nad dependent epimerase dehydratase family protein [Botrytis fragariae]KAF5868835.1 putative nad dependent epimerase dehydratase family protein [Botrytis fragariae]